MVGDKQRTMHIFSIILLSSIGMLSACSNFNVMIRQNLQLEGFHRNLTYDIIVATSESMSFNDCVIGLFQSLPAGIYANYDELSELRRTNRLNAVSKKTNVELPADQAEPLNVYIIQKMEHARTLMWLPVHARYHRANIGGGFALNDIEPPQLYMRCPDDRLDVCDKTLTPANFLCNANSKEKCTWKELPYSLLTKSPVPWTVPVGDLNHYYPVSVVTSLAVTFGSIYLLLTINNFKYVLLY